MVKNKKNLIRALAIMSGLSGFIILAYVFFPLISYDISSRKFSSYLSPVPDKNVVSVATYDNTKASNWFPAGAESKDFNSSSVGYYNISIPKLKIDNVVVSIGGEDLSKSLIQYPGTALPGKYGNAVIFGHSILPQFYNPKDYLSMFSTLPKLEKGDDISVNYDGVNFRYKVDSKVETTPTDLQVLEQDMSDSFLTLVTCVPPGHPLMPRRLVIRARLIPFGGQANAAIRN